MGVPLRLGLPEVVPDTTGERVLDSVALGDFDTDEEPETDDVEDTVGDSRGDADGDAQDDGEA